MKYQIAQILSRRKKQNKTHRRENDLPEVKKGTVSMITNRTGDRNKGAAVVGFSSWTVILFSANNDFKNTAR